MGKVRIELVQDFGPQKGQVLSGVVVESNYDALLKAAQNKLQLKKKELATVTLCCVDFTGIHVLPKGDLSEILQNGAKVVVYNGVPAEASQSSEGAPAPLKITKKVQMAVDQLRLVPAGKGSLSARGRPNPETLLALQQCKGLTAVVTLLREDEAQGSTTVGQACERLGLKWCHAPMAGPREMGMTGTGKANLTNEDLESFRKVHQVKEWLEAGADNIVVHCAAGLHRTGIFLYVLLRELGHLPADALDKIQEMRQETFNEFVRLSFQSKADAIFDLVGSGSRVAASDVVEVVANRAADSGENELEEEDSEPEDEVELDTSQQASGGYAKNAPQEA